MKGCVYLVANVSVLEELLPNSARELRVLVEDDVRKHLIVLLILVSEDKNEVFHALMLGLE